MELPLPRASRLGSRRAAGRARGSRSRNERSVPGNRHDPHPLHRRLAHGNSGVATCFSSSAAGWLPRRVAIVCVMAITGFYMLLTESQPPVVRATILIWIVCGGMLLGRARIGLNSLAFAALVFLIRQSGRPVSHRCATFVSLGGGLDLGRGVFVAPATLDPLDRLIAATRPWPERFIRKLARRERDICRRSDSLDFHRAANHVTFSLIQPGRFAAQRRADSRAGRHDGRRAGRARLRRMACAAGRSIRLGLQCGLSFIDGSVKLAVHSPRRDCGFPGHPSFGW